MQDGSPGKTRQAVLVRDGDNVSLSHLDTAGYLFQCGLSCVSAVKTTRFKYEIVFYDPDNKAEDLALKYVNACCADHADAVRRLKLVSHKFSGRDDDSRRRSGSRH